jgi:predicted RNA-binding Zn ribbon-like protein
MVSEPLRLESVLVILIDLAEGYLSSVRSIAQSELRKNAGALAELCILLDIPSAVKQCGNPECSMVFCDFTATGRRRWCTIATCGNRMKVAAFRERQQTSS